MLDEVLLALSMAFAIERMCKGTLVVTTVALLFSTWSAQAPIQAHEGHVIFSAGEPGDPRKPGRTIRVAMIDDGSETDMKFEPAVITVRKGEQIRFVLENAGTESHEFSAEISGSDLCPRRRPGGGLAEPINRPAIWKRRWSLSGRYDSDI
jgi:uncharacterized cupredoxin-like copper-binding protein